MEEQQSLFELQIDPASRAYLTEGSRWARFLSIIGFVFSGFCVLAGIGAVVGSTALSESGGSTGLANPVFLATIYLGASVVYFFVSLSLGRFAVRMRTALDSSDQDKLIDAFGQLKNFFKLVGILAIISLVIIAFSVIAGIIFAARFS